MLHLLKQYYLCLNLVKGGSVQNVFTNVKTTTKWGNHPVL